MRFGRPGLATAAVATLASLSLLAGCSSAGTDPDTPGQAAPGYPVEIDNCGYTQTFTEAPSRVILMQGASVGEATTMVQLGVEDAVLANAQFYGISDIPGMAAQVDALPKDGLEMNAAFDIPSEQIFSRNPDLVISTWSGGFDPKYGFASRENLHDAGINTLVTPTNCAYGKTDNVTPAEQTAYQEGSIESSFELTEMLGEVFGKQEKAAELIASQRERIEAVQERVAGQTPKRMLIAFPDMAMMNANGLPAVFSGNIYDSVIRSAGGEPSFPDGGWDLTGNLSAEQLAAADVDVLVIGAYRPGEDLDAEARKLFETYPQWQASQTQTYVTVSDGVYLGPANADAIEKIADVAYPDAQ